MSDNMFDTFRWHILVFNCLELCYRFTDVAFSIINQSSWKFVIVFVLVRISKTLKTIFKGKAFFYQKHLSIYCKLFAEAFLCRTFCLRQISFGQNYWSAVHNSLGRKKISFQFEVEMRWDEMRCDAAATWKWKFSEGDKTFLAPINKSFTGFLTLNSS